jgi:uncharacterized protein (TIGR03086 family)
VPDFDLTPAARTLADLVAGVPDDALDGPTPCDDTSVGALLDHIDGLSQAFRMAATKEAVGAEPQTPHADAALLDPEWRTSIPARLDALAAAWQDPGAWEGMTVAGPIEMPADIAALVTVDELVVHGWDLARATGQAYEPDPASLEAVHRFVLGFSGPGMDDQRQGLFGPEVAVPEDAPLLDRVLGMTGRSPAWTP